MLKRVYITEKEAQKRFINHIPVNVTDGNAVIRIWGTEYPLKEDNNTAKITKKMRLEEYMEKMTELKKEQFKMYPEIKFFRMELER